VKVPPAETGLLLLDEREPGVALEQKLIFEALRLLFLEDVDDIRPHGC